MEETLNNGIRACSGLRVYPWTLTAKTVDSMVLIIPVSQLGSDRNGEDVGDVIRRSRLRECRHDFCLAESSPRTLDEEKVT